MATARAPRKSVTSAQRAAALAPYRSPTVSARTTTTTAAPAPKTTTTTPTYSAAQQQRIASQQAQLSGQMTPAQAQAARTQAVGSALASSTTINRFTPTDPTQQLAQAKLNVQYGLAPSTGLAGLSTQQINQLYNTAMQSTQPLPGITPYTAPAAPVTTLPTTAPLLTSTGLPAPTAVPGPEAPKEIAPPPEPKELVVPPEPKPPVVPTQIPEIYKPGAVSEKYTKGQADQIYQDLLARQRQEQVTGVQKPIARTLEEAEAIRVARGQIQPKPEEIRDVVPAVSELDLPTSSSNENLIDSLKDEDDKTLDQEIGDLVNLPEGTSGATLLKQSLLAKMTAIDDPKANDYLDSMATRAKDAYDAGLAMVRSEEGEINKAIDGTLKAPTTEAGLLAKIYKEGEELQLASIAEEKDYTTKKHDLEMKDMRDKRADLEGFTKAKLYSMGAQDSSAGITLLSKVLSQADMQIELSEIEFDHGQRQLNLEGRKVMMDFTNNVAKLVIDTNKQKDALLSDYNSKLDDIDKQRFLDDRERRKAKIEALSKFTDDMVKYTEQSRKDQLAALKIAYTKQKNIADNAYKTSGMMGTLYVPDAKGNLVNTGIPTLAANKFKSTDMRDLMRIDIQSQAQRRLMANTLLKNYGSAANSTVEQLLDLPQGTLDGFQTTTEAQQAISMFGDQLDAYHSELNKTYSDYNNSQVQKYTEASGSGTVKQNGIGIDPFSFSDVRQNMLAMGNVTQTFHRPGTGGTSRGGAHDGVDIVFKDGYVHAVRPGTVVDVIPWDGKNPYGNRVIVKDDEGYLWQYAHMGSRLTGDDPFLVKRGQYISNGEELGKQGNTGRVISTKDPHDPSYGVHSHINVVGKSAPAPQYLTEVPRVLAGAAAGAKAAKPFGAVGTLVGGIAGATIAARGSISKIVRQPNMSIADKYFAITSRPLLPKSKEAKELSLIRNDPVKLEKYFSGLKGRVTKKKTSDTEFIANLNKLF